MNVTVTMSADEFVEFLKYREARDMFKAKNNRLNGLLKQFVDRLKLAITPDPKRSGKYKISDQEYMDDLWILAVGINEE